MRARAFEDRYTAIPESGCWLWDGALDTPGYGRMVWRGRLDGAHRVSWMIFRGEIPNGAQVLHRCNVKCCVNPEHLYIGDAKTNAQDAKRDGLLRQPDRSGSRNGNARLTPKDADAIRARYATGGESQEKIAAEYGVIQSHISRIVRGAAWRTDG